MSQQGTSLTGGGRRRPRFPKRLTVALAATGSLALPMVGSFVPRESGNALFAAEAQAACKTALQNVYDKWFFEASVITNWCFNGKSVTSRHSRAGGNVTVRGAVAGMFLWSQSWKYTGCKDFNGIKNHNCLTQRQFNLINGHTGDPLSICIHTRIYGNGAHRRNITESSIGGACTGG